MSPAQAPEAAYWASGGEVRGRHGPLTRERAVEIMQFLEQRAEASGKIGDPAAAGALSRLARTLSHAIVSADDWRRAAGPLRPLHFVRDANSSKYG